MQQALKAAEVESVEKVIKETQQDASLTQDSYLGHFVQLVIAPHSLVEFGHDSSCFGDPAVDLSIERSRD